jgi:uncharacterized membrane protein
MTGTMQFDTYLSSLRSHLGPLTLNEREEILREISAHIRDSVEQYGASVETVLSRLGSAEQLAAQYRDGLLIRRASHSISPLLLLRAALRLATKGISGTIVFFLGLFGYLMGGGMVLVACVKPILPANTGLWVVGGRLTSCGVIFPAPVPPEHDVLGLMIIPLALVAGSLTLLFTTYAIRKSLRISQTLQAKL